MTNLNPLTQVIYDNKNPYLPEVTFIVIQTEKLPAYVFETYSVRRREHLPKFGNDMLVLTRKQAMTLFDFKKGDLAQLLEAEHELAQKM